MISPKDGQYTPISSASATASAATMNSTSSTEIMIQRHKEEVKDLSENIHSFKKKGWIDEERATKYLRIIEHIAAGKKNPAEYGEKIFKMKKRMDKLRKEHSHSKKGKSDDKSRQRDTDKSNSRNENLRKDDANANAEAKKDSRKKLKTQVPHLSELRKESINSKNQGDSGQKKNMKKDRSDNTTRHRNTEKDKSQNGNLHIDDANAKTEVKKENRKIQHPRDSQNINTDTTKEISKKQGDGSQNGNVSKSKSDNKSRDRDSLRNGNVLSDDTNVKSERESRKKQKLQDPHLVDSEARQENSKKHEDQLRNENVFKSKSDNKTRHKDSSRNGNVHLDDANAESEKENRKKQKLQDLQPTNSEAGEEINKKHLNSSRNEDGVIDNINGSEAQKEKRKTNRDLPLNKNAVVNFQSTPTKEFAAMALHVQLKNDDSNDSTSNEEDHEGVSNGMPHNDSAGEWTGPIHQRDIPMIEQQEEDEQLRKNSSGKENMHPLKNVILRGQTDTTEIIQNAVSYSRTKSDPPEDYTPPRSQHVQSKSELNEKVHQGRYQGVNQLKDLHGIISHEETQKIFVEMCTFARMGFVQPPTCIECAYSCSSCDENPKCDNLVVWRQNAGEKHNLQPKTLEGNILFVTCSTAQAWMRGDKVHGKKWDSKDKLLVDI
uniref:Uncharacterized protein n=1 Tax=Chaetoceros debilis TaxID=122233 RepID=A0A7S3Q0E1_9STRA